MKTLVTLIASLTLSVLIAIPAMAGLSLVCDPQAGVETYKVFDGGVEIASDVPAESDGSIKYDISGLSPAAHDLSLKACNIRGCSDMSVPFALQKAPDAPTNINVMVSP
jgi:hypothetical protein